MKSWFERRDPDTHEPVTAERAELLDAYKDGRQDEHRRVAREASDQHERIDKADVKEAYERGRRDERARHRGSPLAALLVLLVALAGVGVFYLAAREGSFASGGQVVDSNLNAAAERVQTPVRKAADSAGSALENAGQSLKQNAGEQKR
jgi:hypothetical protein